MDQLYYSIVFIGPHCTHRPLYVKGAHTTTNGLCRFGTKQIMALAHVHNGNATIASACTPNTARLPHSSHSYSLFSGVASGSTLSASAPHAIQKPGFSVPQRLSLRADSMRSAVMDLWIFILILGVLFVLFVCSFLLPHFSAPCPRGQRSSAWMQHFLCRFIPALRCKDLQHGMGNACV